MLHAPYWHWEAEMRAGSRAVLISHSFSIRLIGYFFFNVDVLDLIMSHTLVLGKVWWGPDQHHVKYIAWPSPHFSKRYRAQKCLSQCSFNGGHLSAAYF